MIETKTIESRKGSDAVEMLKERESVQAPTLTPQDETDIFILKDLDLRHVLTSLRKVNTKSINGDERLLSAATEFFYVIKTFSDDMQKLPESHMGLRFAASHEKIDFGPCLLAARDLQEIATEYAFSYPLRTPVDAAKRQVAANFADVTENFLFATDTDKPEQLLTKERAQEYTGMLVESKSAMRHLVTQFSMMSLQIAGVNPE